MNQTIILRTDEQYELMLRYLRDWRHQASTGNPWAVHIDTAKAQRSVQANRRYWSILQRIADSIHPDGIAHSKEAWHGYFAGEFIGWEDTPYGTASIPLTTSKLNVTEFADYVTKVEAWAAQEGVNIGD